MVRKLSQLRSVLSACLLSLLILHPVWADDTEIFFSSEPSPPNVLIVFDASSSMGRYDCLNGISHFFNCNDGSPNGTTMRVGRMVVALKEIVANSTNINLGFMRFSGPLAGGGVGSVVYPVTDPSGNRDAMEMVLDEIVTNGSTPTVAALEESWRYFTGQPVLHGLARQGSGWERVSHPLSYTGGSLDRPVGCVDANPNTSVCANEQILGEPVYIAPEVGECQSNHIVIVTDGQPTEVASTTHDTIEKLIGGECTSHGNTAQKCGVEMSRYMFEEEDITTHLIGFNLRNDWIVDVASAGNGGSYTADSADELVTALSNIVNVAAAPGGTFVAPSVTVDQFSRLAHRKETYLALFKPQQTARWKGNLKKYELTGSVATLKDADGNNAVNPATGEFFDTSRSFWSVSADGNDVTLGGAAENLNPISRNIVSNLDFGNNVLLSTENTINADNLAVGMLGDNNADEQELLIDWLMGFDVADENGDGQTNDARNHIGDPLHSNPVVVTYGVAADETVDEENLDTMVYFGTNEGFLHGIDAETGAEAFAYMPKELMPNVATLFENQTLSELAKKPYGLDGDLTLRTIDHNNNGLIEVDQGDKAYLYVGMRRGGNNYYALDVSVKGEPEFLWQINGGEGDFTELGQSWSKPIPTTIKVNDVRNEVLVFGGGYDVEQDEKAVRVTDDIDSVGRGIFIVDADTGTLVWSGTFPRDDLPVSDKHQTFSEMKYSIPADLAVVVNPDSGLLSQIYVGDMGGRLWRFDVDNGSNSIGDLIDGGIIADFGEDNDPAGARRFFATPDLSLSRVNRQLVINIGIGSGYRAHPLDENIEDNFFLLRYPFKGHEDANYGVVDGGGYKPAGLLDLHDATGNPLELGNETQMQTAQDELADLAGWRISLKDDGEKILAHSSTLNGVVRFVSYIPGATGNICAANLGASFHYAVNLDNGTPYVDEDDDDESTTVTTANDSKAEVPGGGIAPPISTIFVEHEGEITPTDVSGINTIREWDDLELTQRWFWAEHPD